MLNDREMRDWSGIETELAADHSFARGFAPPSRWEARRLAWQRRFYPAGYLACVLLYMCFAMGGGQVGLIAGAVLLGPAIWVIAAMRASGLKQRMGATAPRR